MHARAVLAIYMQYITEDGHGHCPHAPAAAVYVIKRGWMQVSGGTTDCSQTTTHCVCQEKYKNVRAAYYSVAQGDQTTWPLHRHVKEVTHAHFPEPQKQTHTYAPCCCSMLYDTYPT